MVEKREGGKEETVEKLAKLKMGTKAVYPIHRIIINMDIITHNYILMQAETKLLEVLPL